MYLSKSSIEKTLEEQKSRDIEKKGFQPEGVLTCFQSLNTKDTKFCEKCHHYEKTCKYYLLPHKNGNQN